MNTQELMEQAVMEALGEASVCWSDYTKAGVFDSDAVVRIGERLLTQLAKIRMSNRSGWHQARITKWSDETFGQPRSNLSIAVRANEEMAELLSCLSRDDNDQHAREEVADVVITLCRLVCRLGGSIVRDVDSKMEKNVLRKWTLRGDGCGDHVKGTHHVEVSKRPCTLCMGTGTTSVPFEPTTIETCPKCRGVGRV